MRPLKRFLVFAAEVSIPVMGLFLALVVTIALQEIGSSFYQPAFWLVLAIGVAGFFLARRYTRPWKIAYDAHGWLLSQAERKTHPTRTRYKRVINRILLWVPAAIAAFVLFFYPVASHLWHPTSRYFLHYRVPIPWAHMVWLRPPAYGDVVTLVSSDGAGRFGMTPFWGKWAFSYMIFWAGGPNGIPYAQTEAATPIQTRELQVRDVRLTCLQFLSKRSGHWLFVPDPVWRVACDSLQDPQREGFHVEFLGREKDIAEFYRVVEGVTATK